MLELQEEVTRLSSSSQRGGAEEVSVLRLVLRLRLTSLGHEQTEAKKERAERNRRWENLIAEIGQLKVKVGPKCSLSLKSAELSCIITDH